MFHDPTTRVKFPSYIEDFSMKAHSTWPVPPEHICSQGLVEQPLSSNYTLNLYFLVFQHNILTPHSLDHQKGSNGWLEEKTLGLFPVVVFLPEQLPNCNGFETFPELS